MRFNVMSPTTEYISRLFSPTNLGLSQNSAVGNGTIVNIPGFDQSSILKHINNPIFGNNSSEEKMPFTISFDEVAWRSEFYEDPAGGQQARLEWAVVGAAQSYAEKAEWINQNAVTSKERKSMTKALDTTYRESVGRVIKQVSTDFDQYFKSGDAVLNKFSEEELPQLFDKGLFASHLADLAISAKTFALKNIDTSTESQIKSHLMKISENTSNLENMKYSDIVSVVGFINQPRSGRFNSEQENQNTGKIVALREIEQNRAIATLRISDSVKNKMFEVERRKSEGQLRQSSFNVEMEQYANIKKNLSEEYAQLMNLLNMFTSKIDELKNQNMINPGNDMLLRLLERQAETKDKLSLLKEKIDEVSTESGALDENKFTIVEKESYKRMKAEYEEEKNANVFLND